MSKMRMLIKNELIKLFKRKSTIVMLALILAASLFIMLIYNGTEYIEDVYYGQGNYWWEGEAEWIEEEYGKKNPDGSYVDQSENAYYMRNRAEMYRYLLSLEISGSDEWRYALIEEMFSYKLVLDRDGKLDEESAARYEMLRGYVEKNDWRAFYTDMKNETVASNEGVSKHRIEALTFVYTYHLENDIEPGAERWRDNLIAKAASAKKGLVPYLEAEDAGEKVDPADTEEYRNELALAIYRLENGIEHDVSGAMLGNNGRAQTYWEYFANSISIITLVGIMLIVIAGRIVAEEYSGGTIKFLLICPAKREKILFSKYFTVLIVGLMMMVTLYVSSGLFALLFSGGKEIGASVLSVKNGVVRESSPFITLAVNYALNGVGMIVMATMAFAISSLMKSTALSVGIGLFSFTSGLASALIFSEMELDFARYFIFSNVDLAAIMRGEPTFDYQTLPVAIAVIVVHMVIFLLTASDAFSRRDV